MAREARGDRIRASDACDGPGACCFGSGEAEPRHRGPTAAPVPPRTRRGASTAPVCVSGDGRVLPDGDATRIVITHEGVPAAANTEGPRGGWAPVAGGFGVLLAWSPSLEAAGPRVSSPLVPGSLGLRRGRFPKAFPAHGARSFEIP